jgi:hypothetical protein
MTAENRQPSQDIEQTIASYTENWKRALEHREPSVNEVPTPVPKRIHTLIVLPPLTPEKSKEEPPLDPQQFAGFLSTSDLARHTPEGIQVIMYSADLNPAFTTQAAFHQGYGGYSSVFIPVFKNTEGGAYEQPNILAVGSEFGEVAITHMLRNSGSDVNSEVTIHNHPLKEGFCDVYGGLDFVNYVANRQGGTVVYDQMFAPNYERHDTEHLLSDIPFDHLSIEERVFMHYRFGGSIVNYLNNRYGRSKVLGYFAQEAIVLPQLDQESQQRYAQEAIVQGRKRVIESPPDRPELNDLLSQLGYTPEQFKSLSWFSESIDKNPEGALAAFFVTEFDDALRDEQTSERIPSSLTYLQRVEAGINESVARSIFGRRFRTEALLSDWRHDFLAGKTQRKPAKVLMHDLFNVVKSSIIRRQ